MRSIIKCYRSPHPQNHDLYERYKVCTYWGIIFWNYWFGYCQRGFKLFARLLIYFSILEVLRYLLGRVSEQDIRRSQVGARQLSIFHDTHFLITFFLVLLPRRYLRLDIGDCLPFHSHPFIIVQKKSTDSYKILDQNYSNKRKTYSDLKLQGTTECASYE